MGRSAVMRAPIFWSRPGSRRAGLLAPAAWLWGQVAARRMSGEAPRPPLPAICVGGFVAGGSGKTPVVATIARILSRAGRNPAILTRGYGGSLSGSEPVAVDPSRHLAQQVGDEALLLAREAPVVIGADRLRAAQRARDLGADCLVLDDGFHSAALRAPALIAVDAAYGLGNGRVMPAGPLRAPLEAQWARASALALLGEGESAEPLAAEAARRGLPVFRGRLTTDSASAEALRGRRVFAFAGIGRPEKFFDALAATGAQIVGRRAFPDHQPFGRRHLLALERAAERSGADALATTEKDLARLQGLPRSGTPILTLPAFASFGSDEPALRDWTLFCVNGQGPAER